MVDPSKVLKFTLKNILRQHESKDEFIEKELQNLLSLGNFKKEMLNFKTLVENDIELEFILKLYNHPYYFTFVHFVLDLLTYMFTKEKNTFLCEVYEKTKDADISLNSCAENQIHEFVCNFSQKWK